MTVWFVATVPLGISMVREKVGEKIFFKVRELSGNFDIIHGTLYFQAKSRKICGMLKRKVYKFQKI